MTSRLIVHPRTEPLFGSVPARPDETILLPRLCLGALSRGKSSYRGAGTGRATTMLLEALGLVGVTHSIQGDEIVLVGAGLMGLTPTDVCIDSRGEAQVGALLLGLLAGRPFESELIVDQAVAETLAAGLEALGLARARPEDDGARVTLLACAKRPEGFELASSGLFPWVKQALLLLALRVGTPSVIEESFASADHLERALLRARAPLEVVGSTTTLHPPRDEDALGPTSWDALGSFELASWLGAAALLVPGSRVEVRGVNTNPTRTDFFTIVRLLGARVGFSPQGDLQGEPFGQMTFEQSPLRRADLAGEAVARLGDGALPLLVLLARANGSSSLADLVSPGRSASSRVFSRAVGFLRTAGIDAEPHPAGVLVRGNAERPFTAFQLTSGGDPRLVLLATLLGLGADGPSVIDDVDCLRQVFPRFIGTLKALGAQLELEPSP